MTEYRSPPPTPDACLCRICPSSQKGGTLIAEDVWDLATHEQRLHTPGVYRPAACPRCNAKLHVHDLRLRGLRGEAAGSTEVMRFRCADRARCGATWQVLLAFLARWLWRSWALVEQAMDTPARSAVPARTRRRWHARLESAARMPVAAIAVASGALARTLLGALGLEAPRRALIEHYRARCRPAPGACFAELAAWLHRLMPGIRPM